MFLPVQSIGFLLAGLGIVLMMTGKKLPVLAAPPLFCGSVIFIMMMVLIIINQKINLTTSKLTQNMFCQFNLQCHKKIEKNL